MVALLNAYFTWPSILFCELLNCLNLGSWDPYLIFSSNDDLWLLLVNVHISGVKKYVKKFLKFLQLRVFDSVKNFLTHFMTPEIWILNESEIIAGSCLPNLSRQHSIFQYAILTF